MYRILFQLSEELQKEPGLWSWKALMMGPLVAGDKSGASYLSAKILMVFASQMYDKGKGVVFQ